MWLVHLCAGGTKDISRWRKPPVHNAQICPPRQGRKKLRLLGPEFRYSSIILVLPPLPGLDHLSNDNRRLAPPANFWRASGTLVERTTFHGASGLSAKGASSIPVRRRTDSPWRTWGDAPGTKSPLLRALRVRFSLRSGASNAVKMSPSALNRACSASIRLHLYLGRCPRLQSNTHRWCFSTR